MPSFSRSQTAIALPRGLTARCGLEACCPLADSCVGACQLPPAGRTALWTTLSPGPSRTHSAIAVPAASITICGSRACRSAAETSTGGDPDGALAPDVPSPRRTIAAAQTSARAPTTIAARRDTTYLRVRIAAAIKVCRAAAENEVMPVTIRLVASILACVAAMAAMAAWVGDGVVYMLWPSILVGLGIAVLTANERFASTRTKAHRRRTPVPAEPVAEASVLPAARRRILTRRERRALYALGCLLLGLTVLALVIPVLLG